MFDEQQSIKYFIIYAYNFDFEVIKYEFNVLKYVYRRVLQKY